ncbi:MAG TPA: hypothetical protein VFV67_18495 [Actinophytocola sp.]|uniref:hypothetical protein n=1 Tax=Actinophytocola sp. TaxID=1872138 RepID=UPI002DBFB5EE|nr:hypothetical protein [Actinophytocola sp.]HEU5472640.1 hypothetical protein [Actinophytocola sp.]
MRIGQDVDLEDELIGKLVGCGREAHRVARAHHNDPGSNGFTFGTDRYHRGTELAAEVLAEHKFRVFRRGAGLVGVRDGIELHFAVARGTDLSDPGAFDADSSPARRRAAAGNGGQLTFDGMPESPVLHLVWSGTPESGQTAVHIGRLALGGGDRLVWSVLLRIDDGVVDRSVPASPVPPVRGYAEQPLPDFELLAHPVVPGARADEG